MDRVYYADGSYIDVSPEHAWEYENDPDWQCTVPWNATEPLPE